MLRLRPSPNVRVAPLVAALQAPLAIWLKTAQRFFLDFEHPTLQGAGAVLTLTQGVPGYELVGLSARAGRLEFR